MFGKNPIRKVQLGAGERLEVQEVFYTLQGEGPLAGTPAVFIRLAGCNLRCWFCDTEFDSGGWRETGALAAQVALDWPRAPLVVLTGGEPLRQNVVPLVAALVTLGKAVQVETAGTVWPAGLEDWVGRGLTLVCSPKTGKLHPMITKNCQHFKYLVQVGGCNSVDGLPMLTTQSGAPDGHSVQHIARPPVGAQVWVSPMDVYEPTSNRQNRDYAVQMCMAHGYRLSLQQHKILELP